MAWYFVAWRISELEKDLYYYKMTSREFKKRLRGSMNRDGAAAQSDSSEGSRQSSAEPTAAVGHTDVAAAGDRLQL